jgi:hypothetical protein
MAKLKAHGTEKFRMIKQESADEQGYARKTVYAFMTDGKVLRKQVTTMPKAYTGGAAYYGPTGNVSSGWKLAKTTLNTNDFETRLQVHGFVREGL